MPRTPPPPGKIYLIRAWQKHILEGQKAIFYNIRVFLLKLYCSNKQLSFFIKYTHIPFSCCLFVPRVLTISKRSTQYYIHVVCPKIWFQYAWTIWNKMLIPVKELQLKSMKDKISKTSLLTIIVFHSRKHFTGTKTDFLRRFITYFIRSELTQTIFNIIYIILELSSRLH